MSAALAHSPVEQPLALTGFQERVLVTPEDHDLFVGGGRGGGKSYAIAFLFLRHIETYGSRARMLYVRCSFPGIVDFEQVTREVFGLCYRGASYNAGSHLWRFPNGATLQLDQLESVADFGKFQGKSYTLIAAERWASIPIRPRLTCCAPACVRQRPC